MASKNILLWKIYSYCYDRLLLLPSYDRLLDEIIEISQIKNREVVADLGCGTGNLEKRLHDGGTNAHLHGLDYSGAMLEIAEKKCPEVVFKKYDLNKNNLPFENKSLDKIITNNVVYNITDLENFFKDASAKLKKEGEFIISTSVESGLYPVVKDSLRQLRIKDLIKFILNLPFLLFIFILNIYIDKSSKFIFHNRKELIEKLEKNNFIIIEEKKTYGGLNILLRARNLV